MLWYGTAGESGNRRKLVARQDRQMYPIATNCCFGHSCTSIRAVVAVQHGGILHTQYANSIFCTRNMPILQLRGSNIASATGIMEKVASKTWLLCRKPSELIFQQNRFSTFKLRTTNSFMWQWVPPKIPLARISFDTSCPIRAAEELASLLHSATTS